MIEAIDIIKRNDPRYIGGILILIPLLFHRIFIGGGGGDYQDFVGINLSFIGYIANIFSIAMIIAYRTTARHPMYLLLVPLIFLISIAQTVNSVYLYDIDGYSLIFTNVRAVLWFSAIIVYCSYFFDVEYFVKAFIDSMLIAAIIGLTSYTGYMMTGIPVCVTFDRGIARIQGFFSEPSTLAAIYPGFVLVCWHLEKYKHVLVGLAMIILSFSVICQIVAVLAMIGYVIHKYKNLSQLYLYSIILGIVLITVFAGNGVEGGAYLFAQYLKNTADLFWEDGPIRANTLDRVIDALASMSNFVTTSQRIEVEASGSLARFVGSVTMIKNMSFDGVLWFGYGLSNYGYIADQLYGTVLDFGLFPYLMSSFGVYMGTFLIFLFGKNILMYNKQYLPVYFIFISSLLGTIFNSGGGITAYTLPLLGFISAFGIDRKIRLTESLRARR